MTQAFRISIDAGIAELVIDKPPVNALDSAEWFALAGHIDALGANPAVRVIVIRAEGRGFCAGVDIKELDAHPERIVAVNGGNYATFKAVHRNPVPVIAAVHGFVLGGGIGITGAADIVVASECATFALPEVDRGAMGGGAAPSATSSASASTGSIASKSSEKAVIVPDGFIENLNAQPIQNKK